MHQVSRPPNNDAVGGILTKDAHLKPGGMTALKHPTSPARRRAIGLVTFLGPAIAPWVRLISMYSTLSKATIAACRLTQLGSIQYSPHLTSPSTESIPVNRQTRVHVRTPTFPYCPPSDPFAGRVGGENTEWPLDLRPTICTQKWVSIS